ncbi:hypothetical protein BB427_03265 [Pseudoalteromonas sp. BMB]|uniref:hypothetical protein n=1 Tax=Pseudoalteromonas sp. BMB TaxID=1874619 RepID=UPI00083CAEF2|nr:hypothetical protein [Pseudoalteromonas sp. BMB]ODB35633.1 hypothetical protein BB427_03265 [Pseudoalteromonas sp. BMB]
MKAKIVIAVVCTTVFIFLGFNIYTGAETGQPVAVSPKVETKEHIEEDTFNKKKGESSRLEKLDKTIEQAKVLSTTEGIITHLGQVDKFDKNSYFDFVVKSFPQLEEQVTEYRQAIKVQEERLHILSEKVSERNKGVALTGASSRSLDESLISEQEKLIERAQELGRQAMVLNAAIREAAYGNQ